jgi:hypothetical protein
VYAQNTVGQAAREASRVATLEPAAAAFKYTAIRQAAKSMATGLGLTDGDIVGLCCASCFYIDYAAPGGRVLVTVSKRVDLMTPILAQIVGGSFTVQSTSQGFIP